MSSKRAAKPPHRPTECTPEITRDFCEWIAARKTVDQAARKVGITDRTAYNWLARGEAGDAPFDQFFQQFKEAKRRRLLALEEGVAGADDWRAWMELLRVLRPKEFAQRLHVHLEQELTLVLDRLTTRFSDRPELLEEILACVAGELGAAQAGELARSTRPADPDEGKAVLPPPAPPATT